MRTIAIAGVGLIGGSFGLAMRAAGFAGRILGVSSPGTIEKAKARGAIDRGVALDEAAADADLILLAQPVSMILEVIPRLAGTRALVTDVGSTKARICQVGVAALGDRFLGGHPMAGSEARGIEAASPDLFRGRTWIFTGPPPDEVHTLVAQTGATVTVLSPAEHDRLVALSSHLPQILSTALAATLSGTGAERTAGPGLASMTRLALSSFDLWRDILATNPQFIHEAIEDYIKVLKAIDSQLGCESFSDESLTDRFAEAAAFARLVPRPQSE